ncbi:MAG: ATP synthase F1 subunit delta [Alphaproteobacteria bacterium]
MLGRRYAGALLSIGIKDGQAEPYGAHLQAAATLLGTGDPRKALLSPLYGTKFKVELLDLVSKELALARPVTNLLHLLLDKRRIDLLTDVAQSYADLLDQHLGRLRGTVVSAVPMDQASLARLRVLLQRKVGQKVELTARTDPAVIGGLRVEVGSKVYDTTLVNHLSRLRERLKRA